LVLALPAAVALAIAAGFGGRLSGLARFRLAHLAWVFAGLVLQVLATRVYAPLSRSPLDRGLLMLGCMLMLVGFWQMRRHPGALLAVFGLSLNLGVMLANGGMMVAPTPAATASGLTVQHQGGDAWIPKSKDAVRDWADTRLPWLTDVIPIHIGAYRNLISVGDIGFALGLGLMVGFACWPASRARARFLGQEQELRAESL
jgi:hypothetical protein